MSLCFPDSETPPRTLTDHRGMFNCRLLRPAVIGIICHRARLAGRQEEAGVRGVTPPIDDDHTGAPAKPGCWPCLASVVFWNSSPPQTVSGQEYYSFDNVVDEDRGDFPYLKTLKLCVFIALSFGTGDVLTGLNLC